MRPQDFLAKTATPAAVCGVARRYLTIWPAALAFAAIGACSHASPSEASWTQETGYRWRALAVPATGQAGFTRVDRTGIHFQNEVSDSALLKNRVLGQGAGIALGDVDGDGLVDVFLARTEGCSALYRNRGDWRFDDITKPAGVGACNRYATGTALADVDGDGDLDLLLLTTRGPNAIFLNDGKAHFTERRDLGLDVTGKGATTVSLADVDGNGTLDLYVANYKAYAFDDSVPPEGRVFGQMVRQTGPGQYQVVPEFRNDFKLVMRPDMGGRRLSARGATDDFYLNTGGHFSRVATASNRFLDASGKPLAEEPESFTLGAKFVDLNGDGAPDLYLANDFEDTDQLWFNDGRGGFRLADWTAQRQLSNSTMGVDAADVNGDGRPDLFEVDMLANDSHRLKTESPTHSPLPKRPGDIQTQLQQQRNALFINRGDGTFAEASYLAGVQASGWSWSTMFLDVDLDGWQDILVANGHLWDIMDADVQERLQTGGPRSSSWRRLRWEFPKLALRNVAFRNRGDLTFEDASARWHFGTDDDISHAMAAGDLDGDGDLDVIVNRLGAPALVLRNEATAPRVAVRLVGDAPNTKAVGARIRLIGGATPTQQREVEAGGLYLSHSDYEASFAMGKADSATVIVDWRDGRRSTIGVRPNRLYEITTATAHARPADTATVTAPLFEDATAQLGGHVHIDPPFDDWARQFLLPNSLSQLGPGVAWFDFDGDGDEDLFVGAGRGGRLGVFRNDGGKLVPRPNEGPIAPADFTGVLGLPGTSGSRLLTGVSSWEGQAPASVVATASSSRVATTTTNIATLPKGAAGPLALGDYDGDGDLDLFVGARVLPGRYPETGPSALYHNDGRTFVPDTANSAALGSGGLVSAAMFADIDADGDADLVIAREWGSVLLLLNTQGRFAAAPASWGLDRWTSRWNGIAAGDLDSDGKLDLVATSWGRNTTLAADSTRPLVMFSGPLGSGGEVEPLIARTDPRIGALAPLNSYGRLRSVMTDLPSRVGSFAAYADASVDQVLGPNKSRATRTSIVTLDHMIFLNRGDHFEARPLPTDAQLAPAFYAGVTDFDGDGNDDLFLSQNFFPTALGIPRFDAGRGLLLVGDGKGSLTPVPGDRSGILVYGDQRGAAYADYDRDGRVDLVVSQNGAATRLLHNRGARPGLRVRLRAGSSNPDGIGAQIRAVYGQRMGPVRELQAGSGYWSENGTVQVFGGAQTPTAIWVRWPGGAESRTAISAGAREVVIAEPTVQRAK